MMPLPARPVRLVPPAARRLLPLAVGLVLLAGCEKKPAISEAFPVNLTHEAVCAVDGMILMEHPGPKGQIHLRDGEVRYYCDLRGFFDALRDPAQREAIVQDFVQPFDDREWSAHADGWAPAAGLVYVMGSDAMGAMGPTLVPFRDAGNARAFMERRGGQLVAYEGLTPDVLATYSRMVRERMRGGAMPGMSGGENGGGGMEMPHGGSDEH